MTVRIVVARYEEDLAWTLPFLSHDVLVYNKGPALAGDWNQVRLANVGREGHTYYSHIVDHYDDLADLTVFLQGHPFDHSPNILSSLHRLLRGGEFPTVGFEFLSETVYDCNSSGCHRHPEIPLLDIYEKVFGHRTENVPFLFGAGAQFVVARETVRRRPRAFYANIVALLAHSDNPIEGFAIERLHTLIFT